VSTSIFAGDELEKNFNQKKCFFFFIDVPISDELVALTFGFFAFPISKDK